ncbi:sxtJ [Lusitaniella coriacea LEGE 07157]|uniref:SxtJ n=1 Tax=Lusitaniella coriacea LEGE 07157 TaxID=945747 RepID=A0A8J7DYW9_9CYAN|nr:SxtJ family membrane protein [Lusitaniella coriacea]MBE9116973.1 sxtJ [Lusitaniella coriacea LEGE 07157]
MHDIPQLDRKGLRNFGLLTGIIIAVLFGFLLPLLRGHGLLLIPWIIGGVLGLFALIIPNALAPVYRVWMRIGLVLGWINSRIILGIIFFLVVTPMGFVMRLFSRDPMTRKIETQLETYRVPSQIRERKSMEKPY